jgi:hypothetical protein
MLAGAWLNHSWTALYGILPHKSYLLRLGQRGRSQVGAISGAGR